MTISEILRKLNITTAPQDHHHTTRGRINIDCPYCSRNTNSFRLGIRKEGVGPVHCWVCGFKNLVETLVLASSLPRKEILKYTSLLVKDYSLKQDSHTEQKLVVPQGVKPMSKPHKNYLKKRGFDPEEISTLWGVMGIGMVTHHLKWRLFIPITKENKIVSWTTRSISDEVKPKYLTALSTQESTNIKEVLYGADRASHTISVHEGPLDAWAVGPGGTATCGTSYSKQQICIIGSFPVRIIAFDNEAEAQRRAHRLCNDLSAIPGKTINVVFQTGKDSSRASKDEIKEFRKRFFE